MYKTDPINDNQIDICNSCRDSIGNKKLKKKFEANINYICHMTNKYNVKALSRKLYELQANNQMIGSLTKKEMIKMYTIRFSKHGSKARLYYDKIKNISNKCLYCGIGIVNTIDHFLPKNEYPDFSINKYNLVPSCRDCNTNKNNGIVYSEENQYFHPYYEEIENSDWLKVNIKECSSLIIEYFIDKNIDKTMYARLNNQFIKLKLFDLYNVYALNDINEMNYYFKEYYKEQGSEKLSKLFKKISESVSPEVNLWKHVLYKNLSLNDWFCENYLR